MKPFEAPVSSRETLLLRTNAKNSLAEIWRDDPFKEWQSCIPEEDAEGERDPLYDDPGEEAVELELVRSGVHLPTTTQLIFLNFLENLTYMEQFA